MNNKTQNEVNIVTAAVLASWLGTSERWVQQLAKDDPNTGRKALMKKDGRGNYLLRQSITAYIAHLKNNQSDTAPRARLDAAKASKAELELAQAQKTVVPIDHVVAIVGDLILTAKTRLLAIEGEFEDAKVRQKVRKHIRDAITSLANYDPSELLRRLGASESG